MAAAVCVFMCVRFAFARSAVDVWLDLCVRANIRMRVRIVYVCVSVSGSESGWLESKSVAEQHVFLATGDVIRIGAHIHTYIPELHVCYHNGFRLGSLAGSKDFREYFSTFASCYNC